MGDVTNEGSGWHRESRRHAEAAKKGKPTHTPRVEGSSRLPKGMTEDKEHWKMISDPGAKWYSYRGHSILKPSHGKCSMMPGEYEKLGAVVESNSLNVMAKEIDKRMAIMGNRAKHYDSWQDVDPNVDTNCAIVDGEAQTIEDMLRDGTPKADVQWEKESVQDRMRFLNQDQRRRFKDHAGNNYPHFIKLMGWK